MTIPQTDMPTIVYIDGECNLCSQLSLFFLRRSESLDVSFALLQEHPEIISITGKLNTIVIQVNEEYYIGRKAILYLISQMKFPYPILGRILNLFPNFIIEGVYRIIVFTRYKFWGRKVCSLPNALPKSNR